MGLSQKTKRPNHVVNANSFDAKDPGSSNAMHDWVGVGAQDGLEKEGKMQKHSTSPPKNISTQRDIKESEDNSSGGLFDWLPSIPGVPFLDKGESTAADANEEKVEEEVRKEGIVAKTIRSIRNKLISRKLEGKIYMYRSTGVITTAVTCDVKRSDQKSFETNEDGKPVQEDLSDLSYVDKRALTMTDTILNNLESRSVAWDGVDFSEDILLTRGATVGITDPIFGLLTLSIQLSISATVTSLLASHKRYEAGHKHAAEVKARQHAERKARGEEEPSLLSQLTFGAFGCETSNSERKDVNAKHSDVTMQGAKELPEKQPPAVFASHIVNDHHHNNNALHPQDPLQQMQMHETQQPTHPYPLPGHVVMEQDYGEEGLLPGETGMTNLHVC